MIHVCGLIECPISKVRIEVDEYVPLRFRSYDGLLGASYLRIGDFISSLLEFIVDPNSGAIRGINLTSFDSIHDFRTLYEIPSKLGYPTVELSQEQLDGPPAARRLDIRQPFSVGFSSDTVEVDFGRLANADRSIRCSVVEFFVETDMLVGLRITEVSKEQLFLIQAQRAT